MPHWQQKNSTLVVILQTCLMLSFNIQLPKAAQQISRTPAADSSLRSDAPGG